MKSSIIRARAERDLIEHFASIAQDNSAAAERFLKIAQRSFRRIGEMPGIGRKWESDDARLQGIRLYTMPAPYRSYLIF